MMRTAPLSSTTGNLTSTVELHDLRNASISFGNGVVAAASSKKRSVDSRKDSSPAATAESGRTRAPEIAGAYVGRGTRKERSRRVSRVVQRVDIGGGGGD